MRDHPYLRELVSATLTGLGVYAVCALVIVAAEVLNRRDMRVYRTPNALNDLAYVVFYQCSIYGLLVGPLFGLLASRLQFLRAGVMLHLPPVAAWIACWVIFDFLNYWMHRLQHAARPLWAFHRVHHAQTRLTFLSANRIHALEQLYVGVLMMVPVFFLGMPQPRWLPILFVQVFSETLQHARLNWSFGPLQRWMVSPLFHSVHHSADAREHNANFGRIFAIWDVMFGTFVPALEIERSYGVDEMQVPETLAAQFVHPFQFLSLTR